MYGMLYACAGCGDSSYIALINLTGCFSCIFEHNKFQSIFIQILSSFVSFQTKGFSFIFIFVLIAFTYEFVYGSITVYFDIIFFTINIVRMSGLERAGKI